VHCYHIKPRPDVNNQLTCGVSVPYFCSRVYSMSSKSAGLFTKSIRMNVCYAESETKSVCLNIKRERLDSSEEYDTPVEVQRYAPSLLATTAYRQLAPEVASKRTAGDVVPYNQQNVSPKTFSSDNRFVNVTNTGMIYEHKHSSVKSSQIFHLKSFNDCCLQVFRKTRSRLYCAQIFNRYFSCDSLIDTVTIGRAIRLCTFILVPVATVHQKTQGPRLVTN
jgi:hypothetical protein